MLEANDFPPGPPLPPRTRRSSPSPPSWPSSFAAAQVVVPTHCVVMKGEPPAPHPLPTSREPRAEVLQESPAVVSVDGGRGGGGSGCGAYGLCIVGRSRL